MQLDLPTRRRGFANHSIALAFFGSFIVLIGMFALAILLSGGARVSSQANVQLVLRCAAGIQPPCDRIIAAYRETYPHVDIEVDYQGSGTLLESIRIEQSQGVSRCDLYLAADETYVEVGQKDGLLAEVIPIALQQPVIAVKKGNPKNIRSLEDLLRDDVRFAIADPEGASIGRVTKLIAEEAGIWNELMRRRKMMVAKIPELVNAVVIGDAIDAALIWDATVQQVHALESVDFPLASIGASEVSISLVSTTSQSIQALHFARYVASRDKGQPQFVAMGYQPVEADVWSDHPQVQLYAGSMFQAGVEETIANFETREGVTVDRIYNGCGVLVAQMQAGGTPGAYLSCDSSYLDLVAERFRQPTVISENDMVIVVKQGNPRNIQSLADFAQPGHRVGVCHPTDSALGHLTNQMLKSKGLESVYDDPALMVATGPMMMNAIAVGKEGGLDAAIVYRSNVLSNPDNLQTVEVIELAADTTLAKATQPWAIAKETDNARLLGRLYEAIVAESSRQRFIDSGFRWRLDAIKP